MSIVLDESIFVLFSLSRLPGARARSPSILMYIVGWVRARVRQDEEEGKELFYRYFL
jgi:hypothetical protein